MLLKSYETYNRRHSQIIEESKKIEEVLHELAKFTHKDLDLNQIQDVLYKSIHVLLLVTHHWQKLQNMFEGFHVVIKNCLKEGVQKFGNLATEANKLPRDSLQNAQIMFQTLIEESIQAEQIAHTVKSISSLYVEVSKTYLLDGLIRLQRIDALDPSKDREKMEEMRKELQEDQKRATNGILEISEKNKTKFGERIKNLEKILSENQLEAWYK